MTSPRDIRRRCKERGCAITWAVRSEDGIEVDHATRTLSGSDVYVTRVFDGATVLDTTGRRQDWSPEQAAAIEDWCRQLHLMPLGEIP